MAEKFSPGPYNAGPDFTAGGGSDPTTPAGERERFISATCNGENCSVCGEPAVAKIGEEIPPDDPNRFRHNLTAYVCGDHFDMVLRPYAPKPARETTVTVLNYCEMFHLRLYPDRLYRFVVDPNCAKCVGYSGGGRR